MNEASLEKQLNQLQLTHGYVKSERRSGTQNLQQRDLFPDSPPPEHVNAAAYTYAVKLLNDLKHDQPSEDQEFKFSRDFVEQLSRLPLTTRIVFYVVLRAELRYQGGYKRRETTFDRAFERSLQEIIQQMQKLLDLRRSMASATTTKHGSYLSFQGRYSSVLVPSLLVANLEQLDQSLNVEVQVCDACDLEKGSLDVIICDPPYGFNTTEDRDSLAVLYSNFLDAALRALRDHGHLIICLPAESYTGRDLPYCTHARLVSNQVLVKAHRLGKHVYLPGRSLPPRMLAPPYYWEAERALRRTILDFRVAQNNGSMRPAC